MEEVWKDISLSSLQQPYNCTHQLNFQDFLPPSTTKDPPPPTRVYEASSARSGGATAFGPHAPPPATVLSLSSGGSDELFCGLEKSDRTSSHPQLQSHTYGRNPLEALVKKRVNEDSDRRHKRLMKNRESADRSRARKQVSLSLSLSMILTNSISIFKFFLFLFFHFGFLDYAYTNELENEVGRLLKENANLRRQLEKFCSEATSAQVPKKHTLQRTLTAPF
ncbi:Protein FD [Camellia lanceoleosa]|uniref:Protein FD n=1 Tax=Camellia lanceoleosa TaxID=1840588 RepID=A0ACC0GV85_9ERIC|nr:Protein FD [Camellia lanceoleosa]